MKRDRILKKNQTIEQTKVITIKTSLRSIITKLFKVIVANCLHKVQVVQKSTYF